MQQQHSANAHEPIFEHRVRMRAYDLYTQRGKVDGHALDDWLRAEQETLRDSSQWASDWRLDSDK